MPLSSNSRIHWLGSGGPATRRGCSYASEPDPATACVPCNSKGGDPMKNLAIAFLCVTIGAVVVFAALSMFSVQEKVAAPIAGAMFGAITYVQGQLDKEKSGR